VVTLAIVVHAAPPFVENSQRTTDPVWPLNVNVPLAEEHWVEFEVTDPPTEEGCTNIEVEDVAAVQGAFVTIYV
jgi:hypothetical protein